MVRIKVGSNFIALNITPNGTVLESDLKDVCPYCGKVDCYADCDGSAGDIDGLESEDQMESRRDYNNAINGLESLILAQACTGMDIQKDIYIQCIQTAIDAITNNLT